MVLFGCLCSIADVSKSLSTVTLYAGVIHSVLFSPKLMCECISLFNHRLHSSPSLTANIKGKFFYFSLSHLNSLSRALRKDPDTVGLNLRRSKSLCDLSTLKSVVEYKTSPTFEKRVVTRHQSCPDLLEMQSLHDMHPQLHTAIGSQDFYYKHRPM